MSSDEAGGVLADLTAELRGPDGPLQMIDTARVVGALRAVELVLFAWLGRLAPTAGTPEEVVWASSASLQAAWRAGELQQLLPVSPGLEPVGDALAPSSRAAARLRELNAAEQVERPERVPEVAAAWYRALAASYRFRLERLSPAADGPLGRVFCRVEADLQAEEEAVRRLPKPPGRSA
ncbi:MAG: hypothetical protein ACLQNG_08285 [Acidimicrobiales bacterium]